MRNRIHVTIDPVGEPGKVTIQHGIYRKAVFVEPDSVEWTSLLVAVQRVMLHQIAVERTAGVPESSPRTSSTL